MGVLRTCAPLVTAKEIICDHDGLHLGHTGCILTGVCTDLLRRARMHVPCKACCCASVQALLLTLAVARSGNLSLCASPLQLSFCALTPCAGLQMSRAHTCVHIDLPLQGLQTSACCSCVSHVHEQCSIHANWESLRVLPSFAGLHTFPAGSSWSPRQTPSRLQRASCRLQLPSQSFRLESLQQKAETSEKHSHCTRPVQLSATKRVHL